MSVSPASLHRVTVQAAREADEKAKNGRLAPAEHTQYDLHLNQLAQARRRIGQVKSIARKTEVKKEIIPEFLPYLDGVLQAQSSQQDQVLVTVMLWCLDIEDYQRGLDLAEFAIENKMVMGADFSRDLPDVVAEELANRTIGHDQPDSMTDTMRRVLDLVHQLDLHDEVSAKLHKAMGLCLEKIEPSNALRAFEMAKRFNPKISVTRQINRLKKELE